MNAKPLGLAIAMTLASPFIMGPEQQPWMSYFEAAEQAVAEGRWQDFQREYRAGIQSAEGQTAPSEDLAGALAELGERLIETGRTVDAVDVLEQSLERTGATTGRISSAAARTMGNLAALYRVQGNAQKALTMADRAYSLAQNRVVPDLVVMGHALNTKANVQSDLGQYERAARLYQRGLVLLEDARGPEHVDVASTRANLASAYLELDRASEAVPHLERALGTFRQRKGARHREVAYVHYDLAYAYDRLEEGSKAAQHYQQAVEILEQVAPEDPDLAFSLTGLAMVYRNQGRYADAESLFLRALDILERSQPVDRQAVARNLYYLGVTTRDQGRDAEAHALFERSQKLWEETGGADESMIAQLQRLLAEFEAARNESLPPVGKGGD